MASRMTSSKPKPKPKPNYHFPSHNPIRHSDGVFEFDDSDQPWMTNTNPSNGSDHLHAAAPESKKLPMSSLSTIPRNQMTSADRKTFFGLTSASVPVPVPVNIPDWSKILKEQKNQRDLMTSDEDVNEDSEDERVPPHEYLARSRGASFSVHEGVGRTLKGRDLRRVRNAIWKQVGFED